MDIINKVILYFYIHLTDSKTLSDNKPHGNLSVRIRVKFDILINIIPLVQ